MGIEPNNPEERPSAEYGRPGEANDSLAGGEGSSQGSPAPGQGSRHKIVVSARGGYDGAYVKCLCGWDFRSRYDTRVDAKAEAHLLHNDGKVSE